MLLPFSTATYTQRGVRDTKWDSHQNNIKIQSGTFIWLPLPICNFWRTGTRLWTTLFGEPPLPGAPFSPECTYTLSALLLILVYPQWFLSPQCAQVRARLHQASASTLRWCLQHSSHWNQWKQIRVALEWGCNPFWSDSTDFNESYVASVIAALMLMLMLRVNGSLEPSFPCAPSVVVLWHLQYSYSPRCTLGGLHPCALSLRTSAVFGRVDRR